MKKLLLLGAALLLQSCSNLEPQSSGLSDADKQRLIEVTQNMPAEHQERYSARHPVETLEFFGVKPGDTVIEALPGGGWYSKILLPYLGSEGKLIAVDYSLAMWPEFGGFATPEFIAKRQVWPAQFVKDAQTWGGPNGAKAEAYTFADMPQELTGKVDSVLLIRALHNLARFDAKGQYLQKALSEIHRVLKPGGTVGIEQHAMAEDKPDEWADGNRGYLKRSMLIKTMTAAGFELVAESDINKNPKDDPQANDNVWRLPPSLGTSEDQKAKNIAIGESNRVTMLFRKK